MQLPSIEAGFRDSGFLPSLSLAKNRKSDSRKSGSYPSYGVRYLLGMVPSRYLLAMATQLLNADADLVTIQDLLGHAKVSTTHRYCKVSNLKVQRDYFRAIEVVLQRTQSDGEDEFELDERMIKENMV